MTEKTWLAKADPQLMLKHLQKLLRDPKHWFIASDRRLRLFASACCRRHRDAVRGKASRLVLDEMELRADGKGDAQSVGFAFHKWLRLSTTKPTLHTWQAGLNSAYYGHPLRSAIGAAYECAAAKPNSEHERAIQADLLRCIFGNPFRPVAFAPSWRSETAFALAAGIYEERAFDRLPILADALEEAGCDQPDVLNHLRGPGPHARGCWVVDDVLGRV